MRFLCAAAAGLLALASARPALADQLEQPLEFGGPEESETLVPLVGFNIGGGVSIPLGSTSNDFDVGGALQLGVTYNFSRRLGVQAEYLYSGYRIQSTVLNSSGADGHHSMQYGDLNAVFKVFPSRPVGLYVLGGPGLYYRRVEITQFAGTALVPYCDPWLFICYTTPVAVDQVIGLRSRTDFGLNVGLGVDLRIYEGPLHLYLEGRYHYIFSGNIDTPSGPRKADGQYLPLVLGLRF